MIKGEGDIKIAFCPTLNDSILCWEDEGMQVEKSGAFCHGPAELRRQVSEGDPGSAPGHCAAELNSGAVPK